MLFALAPLLQTVIPVEGTAVRMPTDAVGYHEVYPTDGSGRRGSPSRYCVTDCSVDHGLDGGNITIRYSSASEAAFIQWNTPKSSDITELDNSGSITMALPENAERFRIAFRTDYGVWCSEMIDIRA